ncbi:hypothetical protein BOTBODRAFT_141560 [Botryobasidium botryosum FD-172 SS1]|uniref:Release factor glutamine methyltransferase N-terminal domain-containing protein n=1 Tax=Botryobasidium botryosum (strain FD-172 SS1) TaxID=930990 RepID=A0A067MZW5_BOTB1|nr:hypothetical protein BOTBODRAFT_141560 [Botryobasidium botryosum FD-172 SS1]
MPRVPVHSSGQLLARLRQSLGPQAATQELRWLREAAIIQLRREELQMKPSTRRSEHTAASSQKDSAALDTLLSSMVERRAAGEPIQYIIGRKKTYLAGNQPFGDLTLKTRPPTLIPRPETEDWTLRVSTTLTPSLKNPVSILDLCTGSGCIPLLLCRSWVQGSVRALGVDVSPSAISLARDNAMACGYDSTPPPISPNSNPNGPPAPPNPLAAVQIPPHGNSRSIARNTFEVLEADLFSPGFHDLLVSHPLYPFSLITCNPPYIPRAEYEKLDPSVKNFEDPRALIGVAPPTGSAQLPASHSSASPSAFHCSPSPSASPSTLLSPHSPIQPRPQKDDGLDFYHQIRRILSQTPSILRPGGLVALEVGAGQAESMKDIMTSTGTSCGGAGKLERAEVWKDQWEVDRVVVGWSPL